jgi:glycosyltransferase involved in cell wall biosynthesis
MSTVPVRAKVNVGGHEVPPSGALRVLFADSQMELGGAGFALLTMLAYLDRSEIAPVYVSLAPGRPEIWPHVEALGVPAFHVPAARFRALGRSARAMFELRKLIREERIDVVFTNSGHPLLFARPAAFAAACPCVWWVHGYVPGKDSSAEPIARAQRLLSADALFANSEFTARCLATDFHSHPAIRVVRPGVDLQRFRPDPMAGARVRREDGIGPEEPVIGIFGRLQRWKGQHIFLHAAALLAARGVRFSAIVAGSTMFGIEPDYAQELQRLAGAPPLAGRVRFIGNRDNPQDWMNACDVVVHASVDPEPWGLVVAEAMACGRAVIASAAGGPLEMIEHKKTGWLAPPADDVALAALLEILLANAPLRTLLGEAAHRYAHQAFDPRRAAACLAAELSAVRGVHLGRVELQAVPGR